jgi:PTS system nitrogen regulatory IIA component
MELSDILSEGSVFFFSGISTKAQLLETIAEKAGTLLHQSPDLVLEALVNREALGSTGLGEGIAVPHGKLPGLPHVVGIFARLETPIEFEAIDDQPVDLVMVLLAPVGAGAEHLKALSRVARALRNEAIVEQLRRARDPATLFAILAGPKAAHKAA